MKFILATLIYMAFTFGGVFIDHLLETYFYYGLPTIFYYTVGWLAAGVYLACVKERRVK